MHPDHSIRANDAFTDLLSRYAEYYRLASLLPPDVDKHLGQVAEAAQQAALEALLALIDAHTAARVAQTLLQHTEATQLAQKQGKPKRGYRPRS